MSKPGENAARRKTRKPRHVYPCTNHPNIPAVAQCEVCKKPICKKCVALFDGPNICSDACWNTLTGSDYKKATAEERAARQRKDQRADRAVTLGMWVAALVVVGGIAAYILVRMVDQTGKKLWETFDTGYSHNYSTDPYSVTVLFATSRGAIKALNARTGKPLWTVNLPRGERPSRPQMIDNDTCLVQSGNKLFLCGSSRSVPLWKLTVPQPFICGEPIVRGETVFVASSDNFSYYDYTDYSSFDSFDPDMSLPEEIVSSAMPKPGKMTSPPGMAPPEEGRESGVNETGAEETESTKTSTITAANMDSGEALWNTKLEDLSVVGLIADEQHIYATGYRPMTYEEYSESLRKSYASEGSEEETEENEEDLGTTQLWALNAKTGTPEWKLDGTGDFLVAPMITEKGIIFATRRNIYLVSPEGKTVWTYPLIDRYIVSIQPTEDTILFSTMDGSLMCLDLADGEKEWMASTGAPSYEIIATSNLICVPGGVTVRTEPIKVIPTKRWKGSEDLLEAALKKTKRKVFEPNLMGLNPETGETLWTIDKVKGSFEYADGAIYILSHHTRLLFMDATADPSELAKEETRLTAYDAATGKRIWQQGIDGFATDLKLSLNTALVESHSELSTLAANDDMPGPVRLIAISLR